MQKLMETDWVMSLERPTGLLKRTAIGMVKPKGSPMAKWMGWRLERRWR